MNDLYNRHLQRTRLLEAWQSNPDRVAEDRRIAQHSGIPQGLIDDDMRQDFKLNRLSETMAQLHVLPGHIQNSQTFATLAQDDLDNLASIEQRRRLKMRMQAAEESDAARWRQANISWWDETRDGFYGAIRRFANNREQASAIESLSAIRDIDRNAQKLLANLEPDNPEDAKRMAYIEQLSGQMKARHNANYQENMAGYLEDVVAIDEGGMMRDSTRAKLDHMASLKDSEKLAFFLSNWDVARHTLVDSLGYYGAPLAGGIGASIAAGPLAGMGTMGVLGFGAEKNAGIEQRVKEIIHKHGASNLTPESLRAMLETEDLNEVIDYAQKRALPIATLDALSMGLVGRLAAWGRAAGRPAAATFSGIGASGVAGGAGEAGAQLLADGGVRDWGDVGIEFVAELMFGGIEVTSMYASMGAQRLRGNHEQDLANLEAQIDAVRESPLTERAPDKMAEYVRDVVRESDAEHVYLDGNALHQSGLQQAFVDALPAYADVVREAQATGGSIQIRSEDFIMGLQGNQELTLGLREHARLDPDGLSLREIIDHSEAELRTQMLERQRDLAQMSEAERQQDDIYRHIHEQLVASGRLSTDAASSNALLLTAFFRTMGGRMGEDMQQLYQRLGLRIVRGERGQADGFAQSPELDFGSRTTEQLEAEYSELQDEGGRNLTDNGYLIDVDLIRELSAEYRADRSRSPQIHRAASALSKELYARALARPVREDKEPKVRFMAGGGGSGKSSAAERFLGDNAADITFDGTLSNLDRAKVNIDAALASGRDVEIVYVYRSPEKSAEGAIQRAIDTGRPVPIDVLAEAHAQSGQVVKALAQAYNADERVSIRAIWNDGDSLDSTRLFSIEEIPDVSQEQAERAFRSALDRASLQGNVHPRTYAAFAESTRGNERANDDRSSSPGGQESTLDTLNQSPLSQDPATSGVFSSPAAAEFAATAEQYGGEAAYEVAREAGQTELTYRQWVQVRTPAFKAWFGDWENDPDNASKVVNPNTGEPLVVYHYTEEQFARFDLSKARQSSDIPAFFFTTDPEMGMEYGSHEMQVFLNIRNPADKPGIATDKDGKALRTELLEEGYDGTLVDDSYDDVLSIEYAAFHPNQIKSATANSGAFSPDNDSILYQNPASPRGQFDPDSNIIALFETADLSTLPHELGHFFLHSMVVFVNELRHIDNLQGGNTLSDSERGIVRDVDTLMDWFGVDLQTWNRMTLDEQRPYHEQFARGFEQYLLEGRAPSLDMQGLFARFRAWLLNIYRHAKNLNVAMTDEVRQVFDRMLASDEAIALAEQNASMRQMFDNADSAGMSAEAFADYQRAQQQATDTALDEMQARTMRDVRLIRTLTSKRLRELQRESREKRGEVAMDARREILSQPVYRAWQMLTARNPGKTAPAHKWQAAVDSRSDSLFVAMAKLGGLDAAQAKSEWGFEDSIKRPHPHHPVLRKSGGKTLDDMATSLMELGYLKQGYHLNDFYDAFMAEFGGKPHYSSFYTPDLQAQADAVYGAFASLRLDYASLAALGYSDEQIASLGKKVRKSGGVHPDRLAELIVDENDDPAYDSGDALVRELLQVTPPQEAIDALADQMMLERYGELATPEALLEAAQMAVHNDMRLHVLAIEANTLAKATGNRVVTARMARELARQTLAGKRLRDINPRQYLRMEARAARAAEQARRKGDIATAAAEKRNQVLQAALARAAYEALENAATQVRLLRRMSKLNPKNYAIEYREQIEAILEKYNLREQSGKALKRRQSLAQWLENERAKGNDPQLPAHVLDELNKTPWQELTPEELQGIVDSVKQIAHLGRIKQKLLVRRKHQDMDAVKDELVSGIEAHASESGIVNRTATDAKGKTRQALARYFHAHRRAGMIIRLFDGDRDGGVWWENIIRPMNEAANWQTATRTKAVKDLQQILQPLMDNKRRKEKIATDLPDLDGKRRSLSIEEVFVMALNWGNDGNKQRLLSGNRWNEATARAQLSRLTAAELKAVQAIWDYFEQFKPQVAALERRTKGVEPDWVEAVPFAVMSADGVEVQMRGGYYPVRYDTRASVQAARDADALDAMREQVGRTSMTTRQSYTKSRADEVHDRPLMLDMSGLFTGLNEVIHDLAYREVLMDTQRLLGSRRVSDAVRSHYGDETYKQLTDWVRDIAIGDLQRESALVNMLNKVRRYGTFAYLGYNLMSAAAQPLGLLQSAARVGTGRIMGETAAYLLNPAAIARKNREANAASVFMADRGSTQMRELNELANSLVVGNTLQNRMLRYSYTWLMTVQKQVDVITWHAARNKALAEGFNAADAVAIAD